MSEELQVQKPPTAAPARMAAPIYNHGAGLRLETFDDIQRFAIAVAKSSIVPTHFQGKPENCIVALQHGLELGLKPMQTFKSIMVVNGIPSIYGDAALALCRKSGLMDPKFGSGGIKEWTEGSGDKLICYCETKRKEADEPHRSKFSWADALAAGLAQDSRKLYGKYPVRMCGFRARGFELRDNFGDVLLGMVTVEEAMDYEILNEETGELEAPIPRAKFDSSIKVPVSKDIPKEASPEPVEAEYKEIPEKEAAPVATEGDAPATTEKKEMPVKLKAKTAKEKPAPSDPEKAAKVEAEIQEVIFGNKEESDG